MEKQIEETVEIALIFLAITPVPDYNNKMDNWNE